VRCVKGDIDVKSCHTVNVILVYFLKTRLASGLFCV